MIDLPVVSIVTPSYNQAQFVEGTIRSVLTQDYAYVEYIIVDGGSTDGSVEIIRKYEDRLAYWVSEKDKGQADAINKGWRRATGEIIAYLNSDDVYEPGGISRVVEYFSQHPTIGVVYGNYHLIDEQGSVRYTNQTGDFDLDQFLLGDYICQPTVFLRASVRHQIGELDATLRCVMDYEYLLRAALEGIQFGKIPGAPLAGFRTWSGSKSAVKSELDLREEQAMLQRYFDHPKLSPQLRALRSEALARASIGVAYGYYLAGDMGQARRFLREAVAIHQPIVLKRVFWCVYLKTWLGRRLSTWAREMRRGVLQRRARANSPRLNAAQ